MMRFHKKRSRKLLGLTEHLCPPNNTTYVIHNKDLAPKSNTTVRTIFYNSTSCWEGLRLSFRLAEILFSHAFRPSLFKWRWKNPIQDQWRYRTINIKPPSSKRDYSCERINIFLEMIFNTVNDIGKWEGKKSSMRCCFAIGFSSFVLSSHHGNICLEPSFLQRDKFLAQLFDICTLFSDATIH